MVPRDEYRLVIPFCRLGYAPWLRRRVPDELVTQSLTTGTIVAASAFDEVTEFGYFEYWAWLQVTRSRPVAGVMCLGYGDWPAALTQLRMIFTCSLRQATAREPWVDEEHVKCTAHQIPNEFRIAYSAQAAIVLSQGCLPFRGRRAQYSSLCDGSFHSSTVV
jgi:hypothetical protein